MMIFNKGEATISINRKIKVEWVDGVDEEMLTRTIIRAIHIAQRGDDADAS